MGNLSAKTKSAAVGKELPKLTDDVLRVFVENGIKSEQRCVPKLRRESLDILNRN